MQLEETVAKMAKRIEQLESRLNQNSQNSSKPPSSDSPYQRPEWDLKNPSVVAEDRKAIRVIACGLRLTRQD
jgi:transposase